MRPIYRFSSLALVGPVLLGLSGCPEQKAEVKGEPATSDNADKSGVSEALKPADRPTEAKVEEKKPEEKKPEEKKPEEKKPEEKKDEGGW